MRLDTGDRQSYSDLGTGKPEEGGTVETVHKEFS
jgi:hypothetical protein